MSSSGLTLTRRHVSISLAGVVLLLAIFSLDHAALTKVPGRKASPPKASLVTVAPRSAAAATAAAGQTRTINLNSGYDQWLASPTLINVFGKDNEWRVISDTVNGAPQPPPATGRPADVVPESSWNVNPLLAANFPNSRWISITPLQGQPLPTPPPTNKFQYAYYFTLPAGFSNPVLTMKLLADDQITKVTLNSTLLFQGTGGRFYSDPLVVPSSPLTSVDFNSGPTVNVITVEVEDSFAGSTGLIVAGEVTYEDCNRLPIRDIPGLTSISFWESTFPAPTSPTFAASGSELTTRLSGRLKTGNSDFESVPGLESYDFFYSDWNGVPNPNGQFVTIEAETTGPGAPRGGGLNIARVDFNGTGKFANSVASFVALGDNAMPNDIGKAVDVDPNALTDTTMGNTNGQTQRLRVTVGFPCDCVAPPSGMVGWWPLNETASATSLQDIIGGNHGTPFASPVGSAQGPQPIPGQVGGAMHFPKLGNGLSGARVGPQGPLATIGAANFTIDAWVQVPAAPANRLHYIVNKFDTTQNKGYALYVVSPGVAGNERLEFKWGDGANVSTVQTISSVTTGQWHHVAVTFARNVAGFGLDIRLYVDGVQMGQQSGNPPGLGSLVNFIFLEIGWQPGVIDEPITIDELEIFNRALLQSEIQSIFNARSAGKCLPQPCPTITINPATLVHQTWTANVNYPSLNLTATGGTGPYTFTVTGGTLPPGIVVDSDGTLHGKPVTPGTYDFTVTPADANGCFGVRMYRLNIISCPAITLNPAAGALPAAVLHTAYSQNFTATGGCASSFTYSVTNGALPNGLTLGTNGVLSGIATQPGDFIFTVTATDSCGCSKSHIYMLHADHENDAVALITLENYWLETITREEALRRLARRNLDPETRARIERRIPEVTKHYLTFGEGAFREYADFGDGVVSLVLLLPMEKRENSFTVIGPVRSEEFTRIERHQYTSRDGKLFEDGVNKETFHFSSQRISVRLDIAFALPQGHPGGSLCCDACEWVHSVLSIHGVDWLCCLGCCASL